MFIKEEIEYKKKLIRELLKKLDLDGIYLKKQANFAWASGGGMNTVGITSELGAAGLLLTRDGAFALCSNIEERRMLEEEQLEEKGFELLSFPWYENREVEILSELVPIARMGTDFPLSGARNIKSDIAPLRYSLTEWEISRYRELAYLVSLAVETTAAEIRPGDKECEVIGRMAKRLWRDRIDIVTTFCAADDRISRYRHPVATERKIEKRAMLGVNARRQGLIVCLTRFVQFGAVPKEIQQQYNDNVELDCILMSNTVAGTPVKNALDEVVKGYDRLGYPGEYKHHHQGGAIGYEGRDYRVNFDSEDVVQENQAFCWNPSISGTKSEDTILATSGAPELLTRAVIYPGMSMDVNGVHFERPGILSL